MADDTDAVAPPTGETAPATTALASLEETNYSEELEAAALVGGG